MTQKCAVEMGCYHFLKSLKMKPHKGYKSSEDTAIKRLKIQATYIIQ